MSYKGSENFKNQLQQVVGSIQYTNNLDVHIALITELSYPKERAEQYYTASKTNHQIIREYIDLFGFPTSTVQQQPSQLLANTLHAGRVRVLLQPQHARNKLGASSARKQ